MKLRSAFSFVGTNFEKLLLIIVVVQLPLLLFHSFVTNMIYAVTPNPGTVYSVADFYYAFFTLFLFLYAQVPFIKYTYNELEGRERPLRDALLTFVVKGFPFFLFAGLFGLLAVIGFSLFVIPGFVLLAVIFTAPVIAVIDEKSIWKSLKESTLLFKKNFMKILLLIFIWGCIELFLGIALNQVVLNVTRSYAAIISVQMLMNMLFYPVFVVLLTISTIHWRRDFNKLM